MNVYPNAPGHRNVDTSVAAAEAVAPKLGRLQRWQKRQSARLARGA